MFLKTGLPGMVIVLLIIRPGAMAESLFEDGFDSALKSEWRWLDRDDNAWNLGGDRLYMKRYGGHGFFSADNNRVPVLYLPDIAPENGMYAEVTAGFDVNREYGQAGLIVFYDNDTYVKFVLEYWWSSGLHVIFLQEINSVKQNGNVVSGSDNQTYNAITIELKLGIENGRFRTWYRRAVDTDWAEECVSAALPDRGPVKIGLFSQADMGSNDWAWFDDFRLHQPHGPVSTGDTPRISRSPVLKSGRRRMESAVFDMSGRPAFHRSAHAMTLVPFQDKRAWALPLK